MSLQDPAQGSGFPSLSSSSSYRCRTQRRASQPGAMDLELNFDISRTAEFILNRNFTRVALQVVIRYLHIYIFLAVAILFSLFVSSV